MKTGDRSPAQTKAPFGTTLDQLVALTEMLPVAVACHDDDAYLLVNDAMCELAGYGREQLVGMKFWQLFHPRHHELVRHGGRARTRDAAVAPARHELELLTAQGEERWVDAIVTQMEVDGRLLVIASFRDTTERRHAVQQHQRAEQLLAQIVDSNPVPTFVIDSNHVITHWNRACEEVIGFKAADMVGTRRHQKVFYGSERPTMADLIVDGGDVERVKHLYRDKRLTRSPLVPGAFEAEDFFPNIGDNGAWLYFSAAPLTDAAGRPIGAIETLQDVTARRVAEAEMLKSKRELERLVAERGELLRTATQEMEQARQQLVQSEKLASIGQLAAGVAHEINNPIGFVHSNLGSLQRYTEQLLELLEAYREGQARLCPQHEGCAGGPAWLARTQQITEDIELDYLKADIPLLLRESREGAARVRQIVADLRDFSRIDTAHQWEWADLRKGLDSTLNIVANEIRYHADVVKDYGELPQIRCLPAQLNQVFMNVLVNAAQAMPKGQHGTITLRCGTEAAGVWVEIADTGAGISPENLKRIFDPFFTTKPVGKGTGLGLSLSYGIVQKHGGRIDVKSEAGIGTTFRIWLPIEPPTANHAAA